MEPRLKRKTGTADFNHLAQWYPDVPMVAYGPGDSHLDHTPHERIDLAEFERGVQVMDGVFARLAAQPPMTPIAPMP
jgi:LysW-gamma-L-lysine carboxypeptidase